MVQLLLRNYYFMYVFSNYSILQYLALKMTFSALLQCLKRLAEYINEQNQSVFVPRGLMVTNPMDRGLRVVSFKLRAHITIMNIAVFKHIKTWISI